MADPASPATEWRNWSGAQRARPHQWLRPAGETALIQSLRAHRGSLRVAGSGHSFSPLCVADDMLLTLDGLRGVIDHDPKNLQATVWAGTPLRELGP